MRRCLSPLPLRLPAVAHATTGARRHGQRMGRGARPTRRAGGAFAPAHGASSHGRCTWGGGRVGVRGGGGGGGARGGERDDGSTEATAVSALVIATVALCSIVVYALAPVVRHATRRSTYDGGGHYQLIS